METDKYIKHLRPHGLELSKFKKVSEFRKEWSQLTALYEGELDNKKKLMLTLYFWVLPSFEQQAILRLSSYELQEIS